MRTIQLSVALAVVAGLTGFMPSTSSAQEMNAPLAPALDELTYQGRSLSYWLKVIRDRDEDKMSIAFDAIQTFGPRAAAAVPELRQIAAAPFVQIELGKDSDEVIAEKLEDLEIRSMAIDALASIGEAASPATMDVIRWALTMRVAPDAKMTRDERFIELITLDAQYRIRVIDAVSKFGTSARPTLVRLLKSENPEERKLAVLILGEDALGIASELLTSGRCDNGRLALTILSDLEPFVSKAYLVQLRRTFACAPEHVSTSEE
jgi:hypothetical protein